MREDWEKCILDDLLVFMTNGSSAKQFDEEVGLPISRIETIWDEKIDYDRVKYIKESEPEFIEKYRICKNDILLSHINSDSHLGKTAIFKNDKKVFIHGINLLKLRPTPRINADFLIHQFRFKKIKGDFIAVAQRAVNQSSINQRKLKVFDFLLPSLSEQRAIVTKIEELFSDLDKGIADLKKAQDQLKVYRQSVLSSSFPKKELMEISKLVPSLSQGWSPKCINQNSSDETQWAVIKTSAIQAGRFVDFENKILPESLEPREQHEIKTGDILITRAGPRVRVGICCLVRNTRPRLINCDKVYRLILDRDQVDGEYFEYVMNSPEILSEIEVMKSGTSDSGLNLTQKAFLKLRIPYVPLDQQRQIVQEIESRLSVCDNVELSIVESLEKAKALRQSILKKAFEGSLLSAEEIAACKAAKDYEPASVLLKKIKAEKKK